MESNKPQSEAQEILNQQRLLKQVREKVNRLLHKNVHIISGDMNIRGVIKGHLETIGFHPDKVRTSNTSAELVARLKQNLDDVDLVICHLKVLDSRVSTQTGVQLLNIVKDMLLNSSSPKNIPFIFLEKEFEKKDILLAFKSGASQFVIFPSDPVSLGNKLQGVFELPKESEMTQEITNLLLQGNKLQEQGLFENAIEYYNKALAMGGDSVEILTEKANTLLKMGDLEQAILIYKKVTEVEVNFPRAHQGLGVAYSQLGNFYEAKKHYAKVIELEPHNVQVIYNMGVLYQDEGDGESARRYFEQGMKLNRKFVKNYLGLAKVYEAQENPEASLDVYKQAIQQNPSQTFLYVTAGDFCLKHNLNKDAEDIFGKAISQNESHLHLYNRLGIALRKQKKYEEAIANYTKAIKIRPDDANLIYNLAKAHFMKGDELAAIEKLKEAFGMDKELKTKFEEDQGFSKLLGKYPDKFVD